MITRDPSNTLNKRVLKVGGRAYFSTKTNKPTPVSPSKTLGLKNNKDWIGRPKANLPRKGGL